MIVRELMTQEVRVIRPESSLIHAAQIMKELDVGALPVCAGDKVLGMLTDRDIILNAVAEGMSPEQTQIDDIYQRQAIWIYEDEEIAEAARMMEKERVRRLIVLNHEKKLVGLISLGDLAKADSQRMAGKTLQKITEPLPHGH